MKVCVVGTGYVGLVTGSCLADLGNHCLCVDRDAEKIAGLNRRILPIYEPGLEELVSRNRAAGRLEFRTELEECVRASEVIFICVGTPSRENGEADLSQVGSVARAIGRALGDDYKVIVNKSTVPVGSGDWVAMLVKDGIAERLLASGKPATGTNGCDPAAFEVVSNPEFLREGSAIHDTFYPDRIVIGSANPRAIAVMAELYRPIVEQSFPSPVSPRPERVPMMVTDQASAEMIKYAANAFLATKISFMNEIANICERVGADVLEVSRGIGLDSRIGAQFLSAGIGWGGSCFPKDVSALAYIANDYGYHAAILDSVRAVNNLQRLQVVHKLQQKLKMLKGKTIGLLGLAFKPHTDDLRDAPALTIAARLVTLGARVKAYDPTALPQLARHSEIGLIGCKSVEEVAEGSDALVLVTEWPEFRELDFEKLGERMRCRVIVDGRNFLDAEHLRALGFDYTGIGR